MVVQPTGINDLPTEIVLQILSPLSASNLLSLALISTRFRSLVCEVWSHRLHGAASLPAHSLILEAFHPSEKLSAPSMTCEYLYTDPFIPPSEASPAIPVISPSESRDLPNLSTLYSHFKPLPPSNISSRRIRRRFGAAFSVGASSSPTQPAEGTAALERPSQLITLEQHELFSQLCIIINLAKPSPRPGLFVSCVTVREGVLRVFRAWLARRALVDAGTESNGKKQGVDRNNGEEQEKGISQDDAILWLDNHKHVGLKLRVTERPDLSPPKPILQREGEDEEIIYSVEYVEVLIRTTQLLLKLEQSAEQQAQRSGNSTGLMIGSGVVVGASLSMG